MKRLSQDELDQKNSLIEKAIKVCNGISVNKFQDCQSKIKDAKSYLHMASRVGQTNTSIEKKKDSKKGSKNNEKKDDDKSTEKKGFLGLGKSN